MRLFGDWYLTFFQDTEDIAVFLFIFLPFLSVYMYICFVLKRLYFNLCVYAPVFVCAAACRGQAQDIGALWAEFCECWELNSGPMEEQSRKYSNHWIISPALILYFMTWSHLALTGIELCTRGWLWTYSPVSTHGVLGLYVCSLFQCWWFYKGFVW